MKQENLKNLADGATTLAISTGTSSGLGWLDFINQYADVFGLGISLVSAIAAIIFYYVSYKKPDNSRKNTNKILELEAELMDTKKQIEAISDRKSNLNNN